MAKTKGKYVSVGVLHYRSELDDNKNPTRTYNPGDTIEEDLDDADVERLLASGAIKESKQAAKEEKARKSAAEEADAEKAAAEKAAAEKAAAEKAAGPKPKK